MPTHRESPASVLHRSQPAQQQAHATRAAATLYPQEYRAARSPDSLKESTDQVAAGGTAHAPAIAHAAASSAAEATSPSSSAYPATPQPYLRRRRPWATLPRRRLHPGATPHPHPAHSRLRPSSTDPQTASAHTAACPKAVRCPSPTSPAPRQMPRGPSPDRSMADSVQAKTPMHPAEPANRLATHLSFRSYECPRPCVSAPAQK